MARAPPPTIDFAPAWLNFNSGNKKFSKVADRSPPALRSCSGSAIDRERQLSGIGEHRKQPARVTRSPNNFRKPVSRFHSVDGGSLQNESNDDDAVESFVNHSQNNKKWSSFGNSRTPDVLKANGSSSTSNRDVEFPSLGAAERNLVCITTQPDNVWRKPLIHKALASERRNSANSKSSNVKLEPTSSIYKSLVPKSNAWNNKQFRRTVSVPTTLSQHSDDGKASQLGKPGNSLLQTGVKKTPAVPSSRAAAQDARSPAPAKEEKTTMLLATVKRHRRGKNLFLQELREDEPGKTMESSAQANHIGQRASPSDAEKENNATSPDDDLDSYEDVWDACYDKDSGFSGTEDVVSKASPMQADCDDGEPDGTNSASEAPLSSSLEAEYRLLRQMGWTECDGCADGSDASDEPPLTDDEIREFFTRNKRKGLLAVPSITHRSFRDALTTWSQAHKSALACGSDSGKEDAALSSPSSSLSSSSSDSD